MVFRKLSRKFLEADILDDNVSTFASNNCMAFCSPFCSNIFKVMSNSAYTTPIMEKANVVQLYVGLWVGLHLF